MLLAGLAAATIAGPACTWPTSPQAEAWEEGAYFVAPVVAERQAEMLSVLGKNGLQQIDPLEAKTASREPGVVRSKYYYVAKAGYVGDDGQPGGAYPRGISLSVDVTTQGMAYVTSYRLTRAQGTTELAVVIGSQTALKGVVPVCGATR